MILIFGLLVKEYNELGRPDMCSLLCIHVVKLAEIAFIFIIYSLYDQNLFDNSSVE